MKLLPAWVVGLAILTSLVILEGTWMVRAFAEWPQERMLLPTERPIAASPTPYAAPTIYPTPPPSLPRKAGAKYAPHNLSELIVSASGLCGVSPALMFRLVARESGMRQWDRHGRTLRSSSGALGLAQVKPSTARGISKTLDPHLPWDNLLLGACYYRQQLDRFKDPHRALVAYHNGPSGGMARKGVQYADAIMERFPLRDEEAR